jgi:hypothetical protein
MKLGNFKGKYFELTSPKITNSTLLKSKLDIESQSKLYLEFEYDICKAFIPCASATLNLAPNQVSSECMVSANKLSKIYVDSDFPDAVKENMTIYLTSMRHSVQRNINRYEGHYSNKRGGEVYGETMSSPIKNWEIDTCTEKSIPQKLRNLYGFSKFSNKRITTCDDIIPYFESIESIESKKK